MCSVWLQIGDTKGNEMTKWIYLFMVSFIVAHNLYGTDAGMIGAMDDYVAGVGIAEGNGATAVIPHPVDNDGYIEKTVDGSSIINLMFVCNNEPADSAIWDNKGIIQNDDIDWRLDGGVAYSDVVSSHAGIRGAYLFDGSTGHMRVGSGSLTYDSYADILTAEAINTKTATFELWVRLHANDLNQFSTLFECGGAAGVGIAADNGILKVANNYNVGSSSYNLLGDPQNLLIDDCTNDFFQVVFVVDFENDLNSLYLNGEFINSSSNNNISNWDGKDGTSLGRYTGSHLGGFSNNVAGTRYDTWFHGAISIFKLYNIALSADQVKQNYNALHNNTNADGAPITINGIYTNETEIIRTPDTDITLPSGATMRISSIDDALLYNPDTIPSEIIYDLWAGHLLTESVRYEVVDGGFSTNNASITFNAHPRSEAAPDNFVVNQGDTRVFKPGEIIGNDQQFLLSPWIDLNAASVTAADFAAKVWRNFGSMGESRDHTINGGELVEVVSGFGGIGRAWRDIRATGLSLGDNDPEGDISTDDLTLEIWFKPDIEMRGEVTLYETGGTVVGAHVIYETESNSIRVSVDANYSTNSADLLETRIEGVSWQEFNQLMIVYDRNNPGNTDSLTLYLNNDPATTFNVLNCAYHTNTLGRIDSFCGNDDAGIGVNEDGAAHGFMPDAPYKGDFAILAVYDRALSVAEMAQRYEQVRRNFIAVEPATPNQTALGATVTIDPSRTISYDASNLSTNLLEGESAQDSFNYTVADGVGGTTTTNVTVTVKGLQAMRTQPDTVSINAGDTLSGFDPLANDVGFGNGASLSVPTKIFGFSDNYTEGNTHGETADLRDENGFGARYMWNAPLNWTDGAPAQFDSASGVMGDTNCYRELIWDSVNNLWQVNATSDQSDGFPGSRLTMHSKGAHTGLGPDETSSDGFYTNGTARGVILAYTLEQEGYYIITNSWINKAGSGGDPVALGVYADETQHLVLTNKNRSTFYFDVDLGYQSAGSTIYICVDSYLTERYDDITWDFDIYRKPGVDFNGSVLNNVLVTTDGGTLSFDTGDKYRALGVGQVVYEELSYTVVEGGVTRQGTVTVAIHGVNDAPEGIDDIFNANEDEIFIDSITENDIDIDIGDQSALTVATVNSGAASTGVPFTTQLGAIVTVQPDGTFTYNPNGQFEAMLPGEFISETFTYLVKDPQGAQAGNESTITVTIEGRDDGVTATDNSYTVKADRPLNGNLITDETGNGVDTSIDANDLLSVFAVNTNGLKGKLNASTARLIAKRGCLSNLNHSKQTITYGEAGLFSNPVVFAQPATRVDTEFAVVRITNVDPVNSSFEIHITEQPEDGILSDGDGELHDDESVSWIVFDAGQYRLLDGTMLEVGKVSTDAIQQYKSVSTWESVQFASAFTNVPVVINQLQSYDYTNELCATRMSGSTYGVTLSGFQVAMEDYEYHSSNRFDEYRPETIGWLAIEESVGLWNGSKFEAAVYDSSLGDGAYQVPFANSHTSAPMILGCIASYKGIDPCNLRLDNSTSTTATFWLEECTTLNIEQTHGTEALTLLAIEGDSGDLYAYPQGIEIGAFTFDPDGEFDPAANGPEDVTFEYTLTDLYGNTDTATVTITVVTPYDGTLITVH
jgi:VCBS repeat-containing protein